MPAHTAVGHGERNPQRGGWGLHGRLQFVVFEELDHFAVRTFHERDLDRDDMIALQRDDFGLDL